MDKEREIQAKLVEIVLELPRLFRDVNTYMKITNPHISDNWYESFTKRCEELKQLAGK